MWKYNRAGGATYDYMAHVHFTLGTKGYKHKLMEYVKFTAFLLWQWLQEHPSMLHDTYTAFCFLILVQACKAWECM